MRKSEKPLQELRGVRSDLRDMMLAARYVVIILIEPITLCARPLNAPASSLRNDL